METETRQIGLKTFTFRHNKSDRWVIDEVAHPATYQKWLKINSKDVVLDIGMNIGAFSVFYGSKAKVCIGFEPEEENYNLAVLNINQNPREGAVIPLKKAVLGGSDKTIELFINNGSRRDGDTIIPKRGRTRRVVDAVSINDLIKEYKPNKIKMDCEASEYDIIKNLEDWSGIESIVVEWHRTMLKDESNTKLNEVFKILDSNFTKVQGNRDPAGWMQIIRARK